LSHRGRAPTSTAPGQFGLGVDEPWWALDDSDLLQRLDASATGLTARTAAARLRSAGPNAVVDTQEAATLRLLLRQLSSPLVLILVIGAGLSLIVGEWVDAATILAIVVLGAVLGFTQEYRASQAVARLRQRLAMTTHVLRDGVPRRIPARRLVPGDVIELSAGQLVPADGRVLQARDFLVTEASLTGESYPVEKSAGVVAAGAVLAARTNCVFLGCSVRSGSATVLIVRTGRSTALGEVAARLAVQAPETNFSRGVRDFGQLLLRLMFGVVVAVLVVNQLLGRPAIDSLLFAVALAVGLSPEMLPAIA
jgi:P-type Mg2+ transporter